MPKNVTPDAKSPVIDPMEVSEESTHSGEVADTQVIRICLDEVIGKKLDQILEAVTNIEKHMSSIGTISGKDQIRPSNRKRNNTSEVGPPKKKREDSVCFLCNANHRAIDCPTYLTPTERERTQLTEVCVAEVNKVSDVQHSSKPSSKNKDSNKDKRDNHLLPGRPTPWRSTQCVFCKEDHETSTCTLSVEEKKEAVDRNRLCRNCLRRNHKVHECRSKFVCNTCQRKHHSSICDTRKKMDSIINFLESKASTDENLNHDLQHKSANTIDTIDTITVNFSVVSDPDYKLPFLQLQTPSGAILNALIDSGATTSIISKTTVQRLHCPVHQQRLINFKGFISSSGPQKINFYSLDILDKEGKIWNTIIPEYEQLPTVIKTPVFTAEDTTFLRTHSIDPKQLMTLKKFNGKPIDLIIGNNILSSILATSTRLVLPSGRIVEDTCLGYITHPSPIPHELRATHTSDTNRVLSTSCEESFIHTIDTADYVQAESEEGLWVESDKTHNEITSVKLDKLLEQLSDLETLGVEPPTAVQSKQTLDQELINKFQATAIKDKDNKIYVQFPFNGKEANLNDNYLVAVKRLCALMRKLSNAKDLKAYDDIIQQQLQAGIIELVPEEEKHIGPHYHIPHRVIVKLDSLTTKLRIVLDASSHMRNELSLNNCMHPGPSILKSIVGILLRARTKLFLLIADIEKAFHQVHVQPKHRNVTKFLWLKDPIKPVTDDNIITYRFTRIPFGITSSPFLLAITILSYMELYPHPLNSKITENLYVDNVLLAVDTLEELADSQQGSKEIFRKMHMNLREYLCNSPEIMKLIPECDRAKVSTCKLLGLMWNSISDTLTLKIAKPPAGIPTKRQLASFQASTYDPMGFVSPLVVPVKSLMAEVWKTTTKWKDPIPDHLLPQWEKVKAMFTDTSYTIPRLVTPPGGKFQKVTLVMFSDASKDHYATCAYLRFEYSGNRVHTQLIFSRTRMRPSNNPHLTIPRMELLGVLIASSAAATIIKELNIAITSVTFLCDNTAVLHWVVQQNSENKWVQTRVQTINNTIRNIQDQQIQTKIRYVPTDQNPADIPTRGASLSKIKNSTLWNHGPDFLQQSEEFWPKDLDDAPSGPKEFHCFVIDGNQPTQSSPSVQISEIPTEYTSIVPYNRTNSLTRLVTTMQKVMRWIHKVVLKRNQRKKTAPYIWKSQTMTRYTLAAIASNEVSKRLIAHNFIISDHYQDAEQRLNSPPLVSPQIHKGQDGIYYYTNTYVNKKHKNMPKSLIYINNKHQLARLIALDSHVSLLHQGPKDTARDIQQRYWIKHISALTRSIRKICVTCKKRHGKPFTYPFATELPSVRTQTCRPFQYVGLDYFGPITHKTATGSTGKLWVMLVTCLVTRAIHLEIIPDNTTSSFLLAMRRFVGRRGAPKTILSDNAPAFSLGYAMINADIKTMVNSSQSLTTYLASKEIEIRQITPFAPWQGGVYERMVAIVKNMFYKTIGRLHLSYIEIETLMIECEGIVNSRPITSCTISISDTEALRPIDFLLPQAQLSLPDGRRTSSSPGIGLTEKRTREYLTQLNNTRSQLWDEFYKEMYTGKHAPKYKDKAHCSGSPQLNELVLVETANVPRHNWPLGRITQLIPSKDGKIRSVQIRCKDKTVERAVNQLIPLELSFTSS
uniref:Integrase catalytic domain-containing protein n=1 Tax=Caenorhabditis tropicalis TaxID=1561998 RepID=A0A1I7TE92_9PELO